MYPDGLTHEEVIDILKRLKEFGFNFKPKDKYFISFKNK